WAYATDILGGLGAFFVTIYLLPFLTAEGILLLILGLSALANVLTEQDRGVRAFGVAVALTFMGLLGAQVKWDEFDILKFIPKRGGYENYFDSSRVKSPRSVRLASRWSPISRVDAIVNNNDNAALYYNDRPWSRLLPRKDKSGRFEILNPLYQGFQSALLIG